MATKKKKTAKPPSKAAAKKSSVAPTQPKGEPEDHDNGAADKHLDTVLKEITAVPERVHLDQWTQIQCPYCGEVFEIHVTSEDEGQTMTEDCAVCCRPISLHIRFEDDELQVNAYRS